MNEREALEGAIAALGHAKRNSFGTLEAYYQKHIDACYAALASAPAATQGEAVRLAKKLTSQWHDGTALLDLPKWADDAAFILHAMATLQSTAAEVFSEMEMRQAAGPGPVSVFELLRRMRLKRDAQALAGSSQ